MNQAVIVARAEADRRVREAARARKRAREALDNLAILVHSRGDKAVRKDVVEGSAEVSGSGNKQKEKSPLAQKFNGFAASHRQSPMVLASHNEKNDNGELKPVIDHHRPTLQTNGNAYDKDKSGATCEKVKLEPKI